MSEHQKSYCDGFVFIPQYGHGTASFNVHVATCLVLHHYCDWKSTRDTKCSPSESIIDSLTDIKICDSVPALYFLSNDINAECTDNQVTVCSGEL